MKTWPHEDVLSIFLENKLVSYIVTIGMVVIKVHKDYPSTNQKYLNFQFFLGDGYHLANQEQNICIRREKDYCEICYSTVANSDFGVSGGGGRFGDNTHGMSSGITTDKNIGYFRNQGTPDSQLNFVTFTRTLFPRKNHVIN